ncbi:hypothetical protein GCM10028821_46840 [Hymenobacter jeollabukensis]
MSNALLLRPLRPLPGSFPKRPTFLAMSPFFASPGPFLHGPWRVVRYIGGTPYAFPGGGSEAAAAKEAAQLNAHEQQQAEDYAQGELLYALAFA